MKPSSEAVLRALRRHPEGLTDLVALEETGTRRLAARISDLRADGYDITSRLIVVPTRGAKARVASYTLNEQPEQLRWSA